MPERTSARRGRVGRDLAGRPRAGGRGRPPHLLLWATACALLLAAALAGCGGGESSSSSTAGSATSTSTQASEPIRRPGIMDNCSEAKRKWTKLKLSGPHAVLAAHLGRPKRGAVVFANDSIDDPCEWADYGEGLAGRGYAIATFVTGSGSSADEMLAVGRALEKQAGVDSVEIVGASLGARGVLEAAAERPRGLTAAVAMSAERRIRSDPQDLLPVTKKIRIPILTTGSKGDPLTNEGKDSIAFDRSIADGDLLLLGGSSHGADLLSGPNGAKTRSRIDAFLDAHRAK